MVSTSRLAADLLKLFPFFEFLGHGHKIDRLILSGGDLELVLQAALVQTRAILPCADNEPGDST